MKSCFSIKIPHATTSDTMVQALLMLIQLLVILLGQIITSAIGLCRSELCCALFGFEGYNLKIGLAVFLMKRVYSYLHLIQGFSTYHSIKIRLFMPISLCTIRLGQIKNEWS